MNDSFPLGDKPLSNATLELATLEAQLRAYAGQDVVVLLDRLNDLPHDEMQQALEHLISKLDV